MTLAVFVECEVCRGCGVVDFEMCRPCDGIGRAFAAGGPAFGCSMTLADRVVGEIVELGSGDRVRILWFQPRKREKVIPETAFVAEIDTFDDFEHPAKSIPASVGVRDVHVSRILGDPGDADAHDAGDPLLQPQIRAGQLL